MTQTTQPKAPLDLGGRPRIALFGGSFDPPHRGHIAIARAAADTFQLDRVLFAPTARQPLKPSGAHAPYPDRLAMVTLACQLDPRFSASSLDAPRPDHRPNYTVDTLSELHRQHPEADLYAIAGADSFLDLPRWHQSHQLLDLAQWIVVSRPNADLGALTNLPITPAQRSRVHAIDTVHDTLSATELRRRLVDGNPCTDALPPGVGAYIAQHRLYHNQHDPTAQASPSW